MPKTPSVNLVKNRKSSFDKFITWSLTIGRLIIIITEGIALSAFLYRFLLDQRLIDLHDKIKQKQTIVSLLKDNEAKYRNLQERLALIDKLSNEEQKKTENYSKILSLVPEKVNFTSILFSGSKIWIEAETPSIEYLSEFVKNLKDQKTMIKSVSIDKIENKTTSSKIAFGIAVNLK